MSGRILKIGEMTLRAESVPLLRMLKGRVLTNGDVAKERGVSPGSSSKTLKRLVDLALLEVRQLPAKGKFLKLYGHLTGYTTTPVGVQVMEQAEAMLLAMGDEDEDDEDDYKPPPADTVVASALRTQPNSVFDLGRIIAVGPRVQNSVFALAGVNATEAA